MRTANPALNKKTFQNLPSSGEHMTINGTVNKTFILLVVLTLVAGYIWRGVMNGQSIVSIGLFFGCLLGSLVIALITIFVKKISPYTAPLYAICEGVVLGTISVWMEIVYPGIVMQAIALTLGTLGVLLLAYKSRLIKPTENFKLGIIAATGAVFLIYLVSMVMNFFGSEIPYIHGNGLIGIGFSLVVVVIAALNLVLDFDFIEKGTENKVPKYMEWYAAFGLMVTLIWLYLEILRLLAKIRSRR